MGTWKRGLAVLLAVSLCMGFVPVDVFARPVLEEAGEATVQTEEEISAQGTEADDSVSVQGAGTESGVPVQGTEADDGVSVQGAEPKDGASVQGADGETEGSVTGADGSMFVPGAGPQEGVSAQEAQQGASDVTGSPIEESFIAMTVGQELHQTVRGKKYYIFAPTESGWYHLLMESQKKGDSFTAGVYQTIYYEGEEQKKNTYREDWYRVVDSSASDYVMWLDKDEKYVFHCSITRYADSSDVDVALTMKAAGDFRFQVANPPSATSDFGFVGTGMKVDICYADGSSFTENVRCVVTDNGEWNRSTSNSLEALKWNGIAVRNGERLSEYLQVLRVDGNEQVDFASLPEGSHRVALGIRRSASGQYSYLELETDFEVSHNPIESISVIRCQDTYEQNMEQFLGNITINAVRKDGKAEEISSANTYIYQSLPLVGDGEEPGGPGMMYGLTSIDAYLERGGSLGEAEVTVQYQGKETAYPIEIKEYPYDKMSVSPRKKVYYANSGYQDSNNNLRYPGDAISIYDLNRVAMLRKDGETDSYYASGGQFLGLPYSYKLKYGMEHNGNRYTDIDTYIGDGGSYGEHEVKVSYMDFETSYTVDVRPNPYVRMEISKLPRTVTYPYNTTRISLNGLEIHAYKNETEYDTYTYGQSAPEGAAVSSWQDYFRSYPKTDDYPYGFKVGEHTVYITFLNMRAEFKIQIEDREPDPEETVYVDMKILKKPARTIYYVKENEHLRNCLTAEGLELELTDSKGNTKKYKYNDYSGKEFAPWSEISSYISFEWKRIDWSAPGTYTVSVFCQENCAEFDVTIADSPVSSFEILRMPEIDTYYFYENKTVSSADLLRGMAYQITFDDGSIHAVTLRNNYGSEVFEASFQGRTYTINRSWLRSTSGGTASVGENAVVFTLFGKTYQTGPITILENPLESLEVVKEPDNMLYIGQNQKPDLYGAKFKITYTGGRTLEVEAREHAADLLVEGDGEPITAQLIEEWETGDAGSAGFFRRYMKFSYFNQSVSIPANVKPQDLQATALSNNGQAAAVLDEDHPYQVFSFTPETEGLYSFFCVEQNYSLYSQNHSFFVSFFDGEQSVFEMNVGGWGGPMQSMQPLKPGHTYYYIVSKKEGDSRERVAYECYISSDVLYEQQLGSPSVEVIDAKKKVWYEYELADNSWVGPSMQGTSLRYTYANGWTEEKYVSEPTYSILVDGKYYNVDWKYLDPQAGGMQRPQIRDDNALVYTYTPMAGMEEPGNPEDRVIKEIPVRLNVPNPIESIAISSNPFEGCYEYQIASSNPAGLSVTVHFKDEGRPDETVVWDSMPTQEIDGGQLTYDRLRPTGQTGENGGKLYRLKVSCLDLSDEALFEVMPNPVTGFELLAQPQKRTYYPFEGTSDLDLYGMEYAIVYRDGTKEKVLVTEHGSVPQPPEGGDEEFHIYHRTREREDGVTVTDLYFYYRGCEQKITEFEELPFPVDQAAQLPAFGVSDMVLGYESAYRVYKFNPQETNRYKLNASGYLNFEMIRYDEDGERVASEDARRSGKRYTGSMEWDMGAEDTFYLVFKSRETNIIGSLRASMTGDAIEKEDLAEVSLTAENPVAGSLLPYVGEASMEGYRIADSQWYGDEDEDGCADFATAHRLMLILAPEPRYQFTEQTNVTLNGVTVTDWILGADGRLTLYYTFPYTDCKIELPDTEGYTLDTDWNDQADRVTYGGTYRFRYLDEEGDPDETLSVKANGNVVELDSQGYYTLTDIKENISVTVRPDISDIEPGEDESKVTMYNRSEERYDVMLGKKGQAIKDNPEGENTLPLLPSYENGSDDFFYGWYLNKDDQFNGKGTRFTSMTNLAEDAYDLFAKWGSGIFEQRQGKRNAVYRVLSFDEYNQMKVEIKGIRRYELREEANGSSASAEVFGRKAAGSGILAKTARSTGNASMQGDGDDAAKADDSSRLNIPAAISQEQMQMQEGLELEIEGCTVVAVAKGAFAGETGLKSVVLPETVGQIGAGAFENCKDLEEINLPDSITEIGDRAFAGCESLKKIVLPGTLQEMGDGLFDGCGGISVVLPNTIEKINSGAFTGATDLTVICTSELKDSGALDGILQEGVTVKAIDLAFDYENGEKTFSYGADEERLMVKVLVNGEETAESRPLLWQYADTDAYTCRVEGNALAVTPKRLTTAEEEIKVTVMDTETNAQASLLFSTVPADLGQTNEEGENAFDVQVSESPVYTGLEQRPSVTVYRRTGGGSLLSASEYEVSYADNINAGTGRVTVTGKGNYTGSITKDFKIGKAEQVVIAFDLEKTTDNLIFPLNAKANGNGTLHYSSSNPAVAVIDGYGIVMIRGAGTAEISIWASETANYRASALKTVKLVVKQAGIFVPGPVEDPDQNQTDTNQPPQTGPQEKPPGTDGSGIAGITIAKTSFTKAFGSKPFVIGALASEPIRYVSSKPKVASVTAAGKVTLHKCGKSVITVTAGNAQAQVVIYVVPKKAKVKVSGKKSGELSVSWSRQKEAKGYVVEYSTDKKFKKNTKKTAVQKNKTTSVTLKKLKIGKKYYVRVKAYTVIDGKKTYGAASKAVCVKVKR